MPTTIPGRRTPMGEQLAAGLACAVALGVMLVLFGFASGLAWRAFMIGAGWR